MIEKTRTHSESSPLARLAALAVSLLLAISLAPSVAWAYDPDAQSEAKPAAFSAVSAAWPSYRGNDANNAVTSAATPTNASDAALAWSVQVGEGWQDAPSAFIIADDALIVMSGTSIEKRDLATGEVIALGDMVEAPSYGYAPPTYAEGMVFAPLSNGTVQAFDVETLESLWVYRDADGGQALSPIVYASGFVYVGFWNGEEAEANFVCIDAADEDPSCGDEEKQAVWSLAHQGGFYSAGALVVGDVLVVGSDNGAAASDTEASASVFSIDAATGEILDEEAVAGDVRSSIVYSEEEESVYLTTKAGMLYRFVIDAETGALDRAAELSIGAQSTSTPVVYEGRVYAAAAVDGLASGSIVVADASTLELVFELAVNEGYPQCSLLLSTGLLQETGQIALYATYNNLPGGVLVVRMAPDCVSADEATIEELYDPSVVDAAQYCIASVIAGDDGTLYYKNDSNRIFAIGTVEVVGSALAAQMQDLILADGGEHWVLSEGWVVTALGRGFVTGYRDSDTGLSTGLFGPDDAITRGQAATIIYRYANPGSKDTTDPEYYANSSGRFSDLPETGYYNAAIEWCAEQGIVSGYDDPETGEPSGSFGPDDPVTREQLAKMLAELARVEGISLDADESALSRFPDAGEASSFAIGYLAWCAANGVITGDAQSGDLNPTDGASRAEMVKMIVVTAGVIEASA